MLGASSVGDADLARFRQAGEGTRRPLRLVASDLAWSRTGDAVSVSFVLPKGGYATTLLESVCTLEEPRREAPPSQDAENPEARDP